MPTIRGMLDKPKNAPCTWSDPASNKCRWWRTYYDDYIPEFNTKAIFVRAEFNTALFVKSSVLFGDANLRGRNSATVNCNTSVTTCDYTQSEISSVSGYSYLRRLFNGYDYDEYYCTIAKIAGPNSGDYSTKYFVFNPFAALDLGLWSSSFTVDLYAAPISYSGGSYSDVNASISCGYLKYIPVTNPSCLVSATYDNLMEPTTYGYLYGSVYGPYTASCAGVVTSGAHKTITVYDDGHVAIA